MSDTAAVLWPIASMLMAAIAGSVAGLWLRFRAEALRRMEERDERERGVIPRMEAVEKAIADMKNIQTTFMANARQR